MNLFSKQYRVRTFISNAGYKTEYASKGFATWWKAWKYARKFRQDNSDGDRFVATTKIERV